MSDTNPESEELALTPDEMHAAMFAQMVMQLSSTALILMGIAPNPATGKVETDFDAARLFIDQLEMLEVKTRGNLGAEEQHLLKQGLMTVRMAFVQAVQGAKSAPAEVAAKKKESAPEPPPAAEAEGEAKKKFSKSPQDRGKVMEEKLRNWP
jgi:hypothetical protein